MKKVFNFLLFCLSAVLLFSSCKKDENQVKLEGGTNPVLQSSVSGRMIPLSLANQNDEAIRLSWTNPNYTFTTGVSSQDINYIIEIDTAGANFASSKKKSITISNDLSKSFTVKDINTILYSDFEMPIGVEDSIEMRVVAGFGANYAAALNSNVLKFAVTPYRDPTLVPPDLYITGDGTPAGWTNSPPDAQKFTYLGSKKYEITMSFVPGKYYKFLSKFGQWQPQYGTDVATGGALQLNDGSTSDPPAIPTPAVAGDYKITVDLGAVTYSIVKI